MYSSNQSFKYIVSLFFFLLPAMLMAQAPGTLDATFGTSGYVTTPIATGNDYANGVAIQADGKIVVVGYSAATGTSVNSFSVVRYNTNGSLDNTFGTGGIVTTAIRTLNDRAYDVKIQADGKIVVCGISANTSSDIDGALVRYNSDGTLDNTFGTGGKVIQALSTKNDYYYSLLLQSDGKIICAGYGYSSDGTKTMFAAVRYNSNGSTDAQFGTNGVATVAFDLSAQCRAAVLLPDGKIVLAGYVVVGSYPSWALVKLNSSGVPDAAFGTTGKVITAIGPAADIIYSITAMADGKLVVGGYSGSATNVSSIAVGRYNSNGTPDNTFGTGGTSLLAVGTVGAQANTIINVPSVGILAGGTGQPISGAQMVFPLFNSTSGNIVTSFGTNGLGLATVGTAISSNLNGFALQKDNKVIAVGNAQLVAGNNDFAVIRINTGATVGVEGNSQSVPTDFELAQNYPNPFNPSTKLKFSVGQSGYASLKVYNIMGQEVADLFEGFAEAGKYHEVSFNAKELSTGVYFAQLKSNSMVQMKKMLLIK